MPIPIIHLITELDTGGAQMALLRFLSRHDRVQYQPSVICLFNGDKVVAQQIRALGVEVIDLGMTRPYRFDALWRLYRLLRQERPFILHCWLYHADIIGRVIGRAAAVPKIITSRRDVYIGGRQRDWLKRLTAFLDHKTIAVCEAARKVEIEQAGGYPDKVVTIYNGLDIPQFTAGLIEDQACFRRELGVPDNAFLIGVIARLHPQKGHKYLLQALQTLRWQFPQIHCLIAGAGSLRSELETAVINLNLATSVQFIGNRKDVAALLSVCDLFVLPSLWEGFPNVILEAMASGTPIVATAVDGVPELVENGKTGLLVLPANSQALAEAISQMIHNREKAAVMAQEALQVVQTTFSIERTVTQIEALYWQLLNG